MIKAIALRLWKIFRPRLTIWTFLMSILSPIIGTIVFLIALTLSFKFIISPYIHLHKLKKLDGAYTRFIPFFGIFWEFKKDQKIHGDFHYSSKQRIQENPDMRFAASPFHDKLMILLYDPALIKEFLMKEDSFTSKERSLFGAFHKFSKKGLPFARGDKWKSQRKFISDSFTTEYTSSLVPMVQNTAKEWIGHNFKEDSNTFDAAKKLKWFTAKIGAKLFFGEHELSTADEFKEFMRNGVDSQKNLTAIRGSSWKYFLGPKFYKLGLRSIDRVYNHQVKMLRGWYHEMLDKFRNKLQEKKESTSEESTVQKTLLDHFLKLNADRPEGERMNDDELVGQISMFFTAETTTLAAFLVSALYFIATNKEVQNKLREEVKEQYGKKADLETISGMDYLNSVIKETFRLQTPTSLLHQRVVKQNTKLLDLQLKKGFRVNVDVVGVGHNPKLFKNPTEFRPERWIEKKDAGVKNEFAFIPFSEGAHKCPGEQLALIQSKVLLCEMVKKFNVDVEKPDNLKLSFGNVYEISQHLNVTLTKV